MTRNQSKFITYFITLILLAGVWAPITASAVMKYDHQGKHLLNAGDSVPSYDKLSTSSESGCSACDGHMAKQNQNCSDTCCQSCVNCSGVATFISFPGIPSQHTSTKPTFPVVARLSVNLGLLERPPRTL